MVCTWLGSLVWQPKAFDTLILWASRSSELVSLAPHMVKQLAQDWVILLLASLCTRGVKTYRYTKLRVQMFVNCYS